MNRTAMKNFAIRARKQLLSDVTARAERLGMGGETLLAVAEEVACLWFSRLAALHMMRVNGLLTEQGRSWSRAWVLSRCGSLQDCLPELFAVTKTEEALLPDLRSIARCLEREIPREQFDLARGGRVETVGWLYQFYHTEPKDEAFALLKQNVKITRDRLPAATQLFTPDWIVRYLAENSLGRIWAQGHPADSLWENWAHYIPEEGRTEEARRWEAQELRVMDPCVGTGHILVYCFDLLMQMYAACGWTGEDAVSSILRNNLFGLDIDRGAVRLACFSLLMKGWQYDRDIFSRGIRPRVRVVEGWSDGDEYGSLLTFDPAELKALGLDGACWEEHPEPRLEIAGMLSRRYHVVVTNPPYMSSRNMSDALRQYVTRHYPDSRADLFAVFMERCADMTAEHGCQAMVTQQSWMFLSRFEKLRRSLMGRDMVNMLHLGPHAFGDIQGEVVQTAAFVCRNSRTEGQKGVYCRLTEPTTPQGKEELFLSGEGRFTARREDFEGIPGAPVAYWLPKQAVERFRNSPALGDYVDARIGMVSGDNARFMRLWHEVDFTDMERNARPGGAFRSDKKWFPLQKGGDYRRWYGNLDYVINWENDGYELKFDNYMGARVRSHNYNGEQQFKGGITWNCVSAGRFVCRYAPEGFTYDASGPLCEVLREEDLYYILGMLSSKVAGYYFAVMNPTINFPAGYLEQLPFVLDEQGREEIAALARENVRLAREDWDSFENSWDFTVHPLLRYRETGYLSDSFARWEQAARERFERLRANEEAINRHFIRIYGLEGELSPEVEERDVTIRTAERGREIRSLLSYAVGCLFGRYAHHARGIMYAGGAWDGARYPHFSPVTDNIIPITDEPRFQNDVVSLLCRWLAVVFGAASLEENLRYIAESLDGSGSDPRAVIRTYFRRAFFEDHCAACGRRPIYWLFESGRCGGFRALVYLHRWEADTVERIRKTYLHKLIPLVDGEIAALRGEASQARRRDRLLKQLRELRAYEAKLQRIPSAGLDLDDGVRVNYEKAQLGKDGKKVQILAKI